jgi:CNT family concentrative nucleoside transporter
MSHLVGLLGIIVMVGISCLLSENRRAIPWRVVGIATVMQVILGLLIAGVPALGIGGPLAGLFRIANDFVIGVLGYVDQGASFVFGPLVDSEKIGGYIFAVKVLPSIIFFSSLMAILYHYGVMQKIVQGLAWLLYRFLKISGAEALSTAGNIFLGQTEAPLMVKPYIERMTRSEVMCVMVGGFANVAGGVLAAYVGMLAGLIPDIAGHLLTVSVMSAPATVVFAKIMVPEEKVPETSGNLNITGKSIYSNGIDAAAQGAYDGTQLAIIVGGMLIAFIALLAMSNGLLGWLSDQLTLTNLIGQRLSLEWILGWIFSPFAWLLGVSAEHIQYAGQLLGKKLILNEFVAYLDFAKNGAVFDRKSAIIMSYALCGFANFGSIAIQIGGIGGMAPGKKQELATLGVKAMFAGMFASAMCGAIMGMFI